MFTMDGDVCFPLQACGGQCLFLHRHGIAAVSKNLCLVRGLDFPPCCLLKYYCFNAHIYIYTHLFSGCFQDYFVILGLQQFDMMCLGVLFFAFILLSFAGICGSISQFFFFNKFQEISNIISSSVFFALFSLPLLGLQLFVC